jgi:hypothetical protein
MRVTWKGGISMRKQRKQDIKAEVNHLTDEYRAQCLWFLREDYHPTNTAQRLKVLDYIERYGDLKAYQRARRLRLWLLQNSSGPSVA